MQFPISFLSFSFELGALKIVLSSEPTRIGLLPWHSNNMILINVISDACSALDFSEVFDTIHYAFSKESFHLTSRASYFLGFTSSYWLLLLGLLCWFPTSGLVFGSLLCYSLSASGLMFAMPPSCPNSRILCLPGYSALLYWRIYIANITSQHSVVPNCPLHPPPCSLPQLINGTSSLLKLKSYQAMCHRKDSSVFPLCSGSLGPIPWHWSDIVSHILPWSSSPRPHSSPYPRWLLYLSFPASGQLCPKYTQSSFFHIFQVSPTCWSLPQPPYLKSPPRFPAHSHLASFSISSLAYDLP